MPTAIVFDLEFTAWEGSMRHRWLRPGEFKEIVQIGAVKLDAATLEVRGTFDALVRPRVNREVSPYFERLTGLSNDALREQGRDFAPAYADFLAFADGAMCCAFGRDDWVFEENLRLYGLDAPPLPAFRNARPWFRDNGLDMGGVSSCEIGPRLGIPLEGHAHNAVADCLSIVAGMRVLVGRGAANLFADLVPAAKTAA